ncbi:MAG: hypothetical protein IJI14_02615, partial [Anaerolineaceae bacterium]|nr:hypothetical protein [Anaerolineaceae bacterium]
MSRLFCIKREKKDFKEFNMAGATPPKIDDSPKSFIGVGTRELVICAVGLILAVMICTTEMNSLLKVGLAVIVAGLAIGLAFGRDPKTGRKIESMLVETLKFHGRDKFHQKGASHVEVYAHPKEDLKKEKEKPKPKPQKEPKEFFKVKAIPLGATFVFNLCSTAFL